MSGSRGALTSVARIASAPLDVEERWLHPREQAICSGFTAANRRASWLAGRWWAKRGILRRWNLAAAPSELYIESRDEAGLGCVPTVHLRGQQLPLSISMSHSRQFVAVTLGEGKPGALGIDLVEHEAVDPARLQAWFAAGELTDTKTADFLAGWAAKEAAHKTTRLAFRPRQLRLQPRSADCWDWRIADQATATSGQVWVRRSHEFCLAWARRDEVNSDCSSVRAGDFTVCWN